MGRLAKGKIGKNQNFFEKMIHFLPQGKTKVNYGRKWMPMNWKSKKLFKDKVVKFSKKFTKTLFHFVENSV